MRLSSPFQVLKNYMSITTPTIITLYTKAIAGKVEDYVEKAHQIGKKLDHFTSRLKIRDYSQKENIQIKHMLLHQDNDVREQITHANVSLKRLFKNTHL